jgi:hypothetical protein
MAEKMTKDSHFERDYMYYHACFIFNLLECVRRSTVI